MNSWDAKRTVSDAALTEVADAMGELADSTDSLARNFVRGRRQFWALMIVSALLLATLVVNIVSVVNLLAVDHIIKAQTSPAAVARNQHRLQQVEGLVVGCENNHVDRIVALLTHKLMPALGSDCPKDSLSK